MTYLLSARSLSIPALAKITPSTSSENIFPILVITFPLTGSISRPSFKILSCSDLLFELVPILNPFGNFLISVFKSFLNTRISLTAALFKTGISFNLLSNSKGRSLAECTARSIFPFISASSSSFVNKPFPPISCNEISSLLSPTVFIGTYSIFIWGKLSIIASPTNLLCASAKALFLVPILIVSL